MVAVTEEMVVEEDVVEEALNPVLDVAHKGFLVGIGVVAYMQDGVVKLVNRLVEQGEDVEESSRKVLQRFQERRRERDHDAEVETDQHVEELLARLDIPTRADIQALNKKITLLTKKVDELAKATL